MTAPCPTFGFLVIMEPVPGLVEARHDALWNDWIAFIEDQGLSCGGGGGPERYEYVVASDGGQATETDRAATHAWLAARAELRGWHVGELEDLNQSV